MGRGPGQACDGGPRYAAAMPTDPRPSSIPDSGQNPPEALSHLAAAPGGPRARMVDIGAKQAGPRRAQARARLVFPPGMLDRVLAGQGPKGPIEEVARLAGILGAKRTAELIPLCHPLALDLVDVEFRRAGPDSLWIETSAACRAATGVEMEALTAAAVAALTVYDMVKGLSKAVRIEALELIEKQGGKSGIYRADDGGEQESAP